MSSGPEPIERSPLLEVDSARSRMLAGVLPLESEPVDLHDAPGRVTAGAVAAEVDFPGFDNSAMDGFAVRAGDVGSATADAPVELAVVGESRAGLPWTGCLGSGEATGISTGAMVPEGADAIVRVEDVAAAAGGISVSQGVEPGHDIRRRAEVARAGDEVIERGRRLGPVELGVLATAGCGLVSCHRRPRVALLTSGDELVEPGAELGPGQIWNSNSPVISAMIREAGGEVVCTESVPDRRGATIEALERALDSDITVICGGVSVGKHDHVKPALAELGIEQRFWGIALKPGRPAWYGTRGDSRVLGLPGNPVSALVVFRLLAFPLLRVLSGEAGEPARITGRLAAPVGRLSGRMRAVPCLITADHPDGDLLPLPQLGSHDFLSLRGAQRFALVPAGSGQAAAGDVVETVPLGADNMA
ncbi:MAG: molybdopterin molybdotransferase MoeA [Thermoleophilia bacterium]|nr:molybdopterin molybdotransferase MoeA [Thermoleophilia bacterium]